MLVVFNPAAGARRRRRLTRALDTMLGLGMRPELAETTGPGDAEVNVKSASSDKSSDSTGSRIVKIDRTGVVQ